MTPPIPRWLRAALASAAIVAGVTVVITLLEPVVPALGLGVLYLVAVVPIALAYGSAVAAAVSVASVLAFNYFLVPPNYSLDPSTPERWSVLVAVLASSLIVSQFAVRSQREARRSARLADEQAALRRVATLVAGGASPAAVFDAVAAEMERLLDADRVVLGRYEAGVEITIVAHRGVEASRLPSGSRISHGG